MMRDGVKHRPLHLVRRLEDLLLRRPVVRLAAAQVAHDVLHHHHGAIHHHSEIQRAQRQQVGGNALQLQTRGGEQQRKRNGQRDDDRAADVPQKQQQNDHHQNDALGEVVQHGFGGVVHQFAAVDERERSSLPAAGCDRSAPPLSRGVPASAASASAPLRMGTHAETTSSLSMILPSSRRIARANWPSRILGPCATTAMSFTRSGVPFLVSQDRVFDIVHVPDQPHFPDVDLLQAGFEEAAAGIDVVVGELLLHLAETQPVGDQLIGIDAHLIFARRAAETSPHRRYPGRTSGSSRPPSLRSTSTPSRRIAGLVLCSVKK